MGCQQSQFIREMPPRYNPAHDTGNTEKRSHNPSSSNETFVPPDRLHQQQLRYELSVASHLSEYVVELIVDDDTMGPETFEHPPIYNWSTLLISTLRSQPHQKYQLSFVHFADETDHSNDNNLRAVQDVMKASTWNDVLGIDLNTGSGEDARSVTAFLGNQRTQYTTEDNQA